MVRVMIVDDHLVLIDGIKSILKKIPDIDVVAEAQSGQSALKAIENTKVDVVLLDISMPDLDGIETCGLLLKKDPDLKIIALTMHQEYRFIQNMLDQGAHGYLLKSSGRDEIVLAIRQVFANRSYLNAQVTKTLIEGVRRINQVPIKQNNNLTPREQEVLSLIVEGLTTTEIADQLFISSTTAETHRKNLLRKLEVRNTAGLVRMAYEKNLLQKNS